MPIASVVDLSGLKLRDPVADPVVYREDTGDAVYQFEAADLTSAVAADPDGAVYVKADTVPAASGAYVRKFYGPAQFHWFDPPRDNTGDASAHLRRAMANEDVIHFSDIKAQYRLTDPIEFTRDGQKLQGPGRTYPLLRFATTAGDKLICNKHFGTSTMLKFCAINDLYIEAANLGRYGSIVAPQNMMFFEFNRNWLYGSTNLDTRLLDLRGNWPQGSYYGNYFGNYLSRGHNQMHFGAGANGNRYGGNRFQPWVAGAGNVATALVFDCAAPNQISGNAGLGNLIEVSGKLHDGVYLGQGVNGLTLGPMYYEQLRRSILVSGYALNVVRSGAHVEDGCLLPPVGLPAA